MENEWGSINIDDEGNPATRLVLIENGILKNYMVDRLNGRRMGMPVTGSARRQNYAYAPTSRMRNTFIAPGNDDEAEIISSMGDGLYAKPWAAARSIPSPGNSTLPSPRAISSRAARSTGPCAGRRSSARARTSSKRSTAWAKRWNLAGHVRLGDGSIPVDVGQPMIRVTDITVGGR